MFEPLPENFSYPRHEEEILDYWERNDVFAKSLSDREGAPRFSFNEGPPTVNGSPGIHHAFSRTIKDTICRYKTMRGFYVRRKAGWDTHGLPVELAVEKQLGITDKAQIEVLGVDKFNAACKALVDYNIAHDTGWRTLTRRMGYWLDLDDPYITCTNNYVESVWWALKQFFDKGLIYKGFKVVPQSPTLGTPLSSHELSLNYKDVRDPNVYLKLRIRSSPVKGLEGAYILVWTTTPWTLFGNVALAVNPELEYSLVEIPIKDSESNATERVVIATPRVQSVLGVADSGVANSSVSNSDPTDNASTSDNASNPETTNDRAGHVLSSFLGADFVGTTYEQIFNDVALDTDAHPNVLHVLAGDFVTATDGTGVVHLAPAFGQDDFEMSKQYNLPVVQPVSQNGKFTDAIKDFAGRGVKTFTYPDAAGTGLRTEDGADRDIIKALKIAGKIYKASVDYLHSYPHCWRTDNPVIYYARDSWFIKSPVYKDSLVALNKEIEWHPEEIGAGRFGNWVEEVKEWSLSRDRYWGTPLPIWLSEDGTDMFAVGSIEELKTGLYENEDGTRVPVENLMDAVDLHRPFVDRVVFIKNGVEYRRTREVIDAWFDSGSMPFAQFHYPFENVDLFNKSFPADFIAEGIDQTRGWFYTMHNISTALFNKPAFRHVIVNDMLLDKNGQKMSKSRGNMLDPFELFDKYGADAIRWYLMAAAPAWKPRNFNEDDVARTVIADVFRSFVNTYGFFSLYAGIDGFSGTEPTVPIEERPEVDRWILSRLNTVLRAYTDSMDSYDITKACRIVQDFAIEDVSNWYVRRNRRRFWKGELDADKIAAYQTLHEVILVIAEMMAPVAPFLSEQIFQRIRLHPEQLSIHCIILRRVDESLINSDLEYRMKQAQTIVFLARSLREKSKIKTRQPLRRILLPVDSPTTRRQIQTVEDIILEEINVKAIEYVSDDTNIVQRSTKPNFKIIGKKYGDKTQLVSQAIKSLGNEQVRTLEQSSVLDVQVGSEVVKIDLEDVEIVNQDIEGWLVASANGVTVALDTELDSVLIQEGLAREFVSKVQKYRKDSGFEVTDRIDIAYAADDETSEAMLCMRHSIVMETLADTLERGEGPFGTLLEINGRNVSVRIERTGVQSAS